MEAVECSVVPVLFVEKIILFHCIPFSPFSKIISCIYVSVSGPGSQNLILRRLHIFPYVKYGSLPHKIVPSHLVYQIFAYKLPMLCVIIIVSSNNDRSFISDIRNSLLPFVCMCVARLL